MPSRHRDQQTLHIADRSRKAKDMRVLGYTYDQIADHLGVSVATVRKDIKRYMDTYPREHAEEYRQYQIEQIEMAMRKLAPRVNKGEPKAIDLWYKGVDRLMKLTGTYQPAEDNTGEQGARDALNEMMAAIKGSVD